MNRRIFRSIAALVLVGALTGFMLSAGHTDDQATEAQPAGWETGTMKLPPPRLDGPVSVERALEQRRSIRTYKDEPLTLADVSQILWAAQGITDSTGDKRTAPSARAMYLLDVYLLAGNVTDLPQGMYLYQPQGHQLSRVMEGNAKAKLFEAAGQAPIEKAPAALVITGQADRATNPNWMYLEAGHAAENVYLQGVSLGIGTVVMGGFKPDEVKKALSLPQNQTVIYLMPLGRK
jgi:SagB-type dehydrogenase family enzyme